MYDSDVMKIECYLSVTSMYMEGAKGTSVYMERSKRHFYVHGKEQKALL